MNRVYKDSIRLEVGLEKDIQLSFKEVLYIAEWIEAFSYKPELWSGHIRKLVNGGLSRSQKTLSFSRLRQAYNRWKAHRRWDSQTGFILIPFIMRRRELEKIEEQEMRCPHCHRMLGQNNS